jgi:hypothetical protein
MDKTFRFWIGGQFEITSPHNSPSGQTTLTLSVFWLNILHPINSGAIE